MCLYGEVYVGRKSRAIAECMENLAQLSDWYKRVYMIINVMQI
jgi:hypothetical protein